MNFKLLVNSFIAKIIYIYDVRKCFLKYIKRLLKNAY